MNSDKSFKIDHSKKLDFFFSEEYDFGFRGEEGSTKFHSLCEATKTFRVNQAYL